MANRSAAVRQQLAPALEDLTTRILQLVNESDAPPKKSAGKETSTWMTTTQVAQELGKTQRAVALMIQRRTLPEQIVKRLGRQLLINRKGFQAFMDQQ